MFWVASATRLARPMPPTPTPAMFSLSLGGVKPRPKTWRGTMVKAFAVVVAPEIAAAAVVVRNLRRDNLVFVLIGPLATNYCSVKAGAKNGNFCGAFGWRGYTFSELFGVKKVQRDSFAGAKEKKERRLAPVGMIRCRWLELKRELWC
jgi:hypothetical protein